MSKSPPFFDPFYTGVKQIWYGKLKGSFTTGGVKNAFAAYKYTTVLNLYRPWCKLWCKSLNSGVFLRRGDSFHTTGGVSLRRGDSFHTTNGKITLQFAMLKLFYAGVK